MCAKKGRDRQGCSAAPGVSFVRRVPCRVRPPPSARILCLCSGAWAGLTTRPLLTDLGRAPKGKRGRAAGTGHGHRARRRAVAGPGPEGGVEDEGVIFDTGTSVETAPGQLPHALVQAEVVSGWAVGVEGKREGGGGSHDERGRVRPGPGSGRLLALPPPRL